MAEAHHRRLCLERQNQALGNLRLTGGRVEDAYVGVAKDVVGKRNYSYAFLKTTVLAEDANLSQDA